MLVLEVIHSLYALIGVSANLILLATILKSRSSGLKSYALIIANIACVDITEIILDAFEVPRLIAYKEEVVLLFHGYCSEFGPEFCYRCHLVMLHLIFHSLFLIAFSFWYRYTVLIKLAPSSLTVQIVMIILFLPNALPMIFSIFARDDPVKSREILQLIYPTMDLNSTTHRSVNFSDPFSAPTDYSAIFGPFIVYTFVVVMRRKVLKKLSSLAQNMSKKTKKMHLSLVRALTYHAILPSTICIGMASFYFQVIGVRNSLIDGMIFIFACIPAVFNPILTLYFVAPYRKRILIVIGRAQISTVSAVNTSFVHKENSRGASRISHR